MLHNVGLQLFESIIEIYQKQNSLLLLIHSRNIYFLPTMFTMQKAQSLSLSTEKKKKPNDPCLFVAYN